MARQRGLRHRRGEREVPSSWCVFWELQLQVWRQQEPLLLQW